jgi:outer membrane protein assembly factor BamB
MHHWGTLVVRNGFLYGLDDSILVCLDPATGRLKWKQGRYGHGQLLLVGDLLLVQAESGDVVLVEANPAEHRQLGRFRALASKAWNNPALSGRYLLVRNDQEAACYELPVAGR